MPSPYTPAEFISQPDRFGRDRHAEWCDEPAKHPRRVYYMESYKQHLVACAVNEIITGFGKWTLDSLAAALDHDINYLRRKLHGQQRAVQYDYLAWADLLGVDILPPTPQNRSDLLPQNTTAQRLFALGESQSMDQQQLGIA